MTTPEESTRVSEEFVTNATAIAEVPDKPASVEPSSPPATPATLSVNEDTTEEADETVEQPPADAEKKEILKSSCAKKRTPFKYNPHKIPLRFIFANRDGVSVTMDCEPADTVGKVKGALLSVWPKELPECKNEDRLRLICMGKGVLMPDTQTLEECQVPIFKTHPTPVNVSVRPEVMSHESEKKRNSDAPRLRGNTNQVEQGCACAIL